MAVRGVVGLFVCLRGNSCLSLCCLTEEHLFKDTRSPKGPVLGDVAEFRLEHETRFHQDWASAALPETYR